ncbi:MAG TPA: aminotransferase class V-fold PLP-dependent enzyme [Xanthomonadales bacterium]|nr:aminotransferase class V-fold PLP-dependent enzyme [Xanthomonadales bacterium]
MTISKAQFPILQSGIYANHAAVSPWPDVVSDAIAAFAEENKVAGPRNYRDWITRERQLRGQITTLIGADSSQDIALLKNTTEGICTVAFGFPWCNGDNVVIPKGEFPSNRLPWLAQQKRDVEIREVDVRDTSDPEGALLAAMDDKTRILAVSSVQYSDGFRLDVSKLGSACQVADVFFFVDAIQHLGALPIDVDSSHIDCLAADAHKWLLGPEGIAIFFCREPLRSMLKLQQVGWHMYENPWIFDRPDWSPAKSAKRFEAGTPNTLGQVGLNASLSTFLEQGMSAVSDAILRNTRMLTNGISSMPGLRVSSRTSKNRQSGIVSFNTTDHDLRELYGRITKAGVDCALRSGSIRLSPHYYQDEMVMERLLEIVEDSL